MDEYLVEINDLRRQIAKLKFQQADQVIIDELEAQLRILKAIYDATWQLFNQGQNDTGIKTSFRERDLGAWSFPNVYFYVYEEAMKIEPGEHDLASRIGTHNFRAPLLPEHRDAAAG